MVWLATARSAAVGGIYGWLRRWPQARGGRAVRVAAGLRGDQPPRLPALPVTPCLSWQLRRAAGETAIHPRRGLWHGTVGARDGADISQGASHGSGYQPTTLRLGCTVCWWPG